MRRHILQRSSSLFSTTTQTPLRRSSSLTTGIIPYTCSSSLLSAMPKKSKQSSDAQSPIVQKIDDMLLWLESLPSFSCDTAGSSSSASASSTAASSALGADSSTSSGEAKLTVGKKFYLTTAINYTNGPPHIGHAYEAVVSDIIVRYHRIFGRDTFFLTGTDEHGQKIADTAESLGLSKPKDLCDQFVPIFQELNKKLNISNDHFVRTTDDYHCRLAQQMFERSKKKGDIYLSEYSGWYNTREEQYVKESDALKTDYKDPLTGKLYEKKCESAYFFRMSKYQSLLIDHFLSNPHFLRPLKEYNSILYRLQHEQLEDLCVSRTTMKWGIPVPSDEDHVLYVWFDALSNYLSGIDYFDLNQDSIHGKNTSSVGQKAQWPCDCHMIGKDIKWFHTVIWPCMLMSCDVPLPRSVFSHGFVNDANGDKMSKSVGNVVDPFQLLLNHSSDSLRYFIATQGTFGDDMRWNEKDLKSRHDAHLTKTFGNLVNRVLKLTQKLCDERVPSALEDDSSSSLSLSKKSVDVIFDFPKLVEQVEDCMSQFDFNQCSDLIMSALRECNDYLTKTEPWKNKSEAPRIMRSSLEAIYMLAHFMQPYTPSACEVIFKDLNTPPMTIEAMLKTVLSEGEGTLLLKTGTKVVSSGTLFKQHSTKFEKQKKQEGMPVLAKVDFRVGQVLSAEVHPRNPDCLVSQIDVNETKPRSVVSGLAKHVSLEDWVGRKVVLFTNLKKERFRGVESQGMVMCASNADKSTVEPLIVPDQSPIGQRLNWSEHDLFQYEGSVEQGLRIKKKGKSFWETDIGPFLRTDDNGRATWNGGVFQCLGKDITSSLKDCQIS